MSGVAALRRALDLAKGFARVRHIAGDLDSLLQDNPMHTSALAQSELVHRALLHLTFGAMHLLGRSEALPAAQLDEGETLRLRLLTPVVKAFSAELSTSELPRLMEALGGQGYMTENQFGRSVPSRSSRRSPQLSTDSGCPHRLIADANVERIWEGSVSLFALEPLPPPS